MKVTCPHCHTPQEIAEIPAITPDSPALKELFKGRLNRILCRKCQMAFTVDRPLVYRDAAAQSPFILYYMNMPEDGNTEELEHQVDAMATDVFAEKQMARPQVRLVFSLPDFLEKIAIRQLGYDDRLVEYAKLELFRNIEEPKLSRSQHRLLLDFSHTDGKNMYFLVFDRNTQRNCNVIQVAMSEFQSLMQQAAEDENIQLELEAAFPGCYVSAERLL